MLSKRLFTLTALKSGGGNIQRFVCGFEPWFIFFAVVVFVFDINSRNQDRLDREEDLALAELDREEARIVSAWQLLTTKAPGNSGKIAAIEYLNKKGIQLVGIDLGVDEKDVGVFLERANLEDAVLVSANLSRAEMAHSNFRNARLAGANLSYTSSVGTDFHGASLVQANLSRSDLKDANFSESQVGAADFSRARLINANFRNADLTGADFGGADLKDANFAGSTINSTNFSRARLSGANFKGANITNGNFNDACDDAGDDKPINIPNLEDC